MREILSLPKELDGKIWQYTFHANHFPNNKHRHDELEINLVTRGVGVYVLDACKYELRRHSQVWLFPGQEHVLLNQSKDYEMWIAVFKPRLIRHYSMVGSKLREKNPAGEFCRNLASGQAERVSQLFEEVSSAQQDTARYNAGLAYALVSAWAAHCSADNTADSSNVHPSVEKAAKLMCNGDDRNLSLLAREVGLSSWRLSRLFKEQTGVSLAEFRNRQRLQRFLNIYGNGRRYSLMEAALASGFGSYPQFHRFFCCAMNYNPAEHRRRVQEDVKKTAR
jgi:AraC-like DNA-binding protein